MIKHISLIEPYLNTLNINYKNISKKERDNLVRYYRENEMLKKTNKY